MFLLQRLFSMRPTLEQASQRLQEVCRRKGIPLLLTVQRPDEHHLVAPLIRNVSMTRTDRNPLRVMLIDAHTDAAPFYKFLDCGNWVTALLAEARQKIRFGLLTAEQKCAEDRPSFSDGILSRPSQWPTKWSGLVTLDLDYTVGWQSSHGQKRLIRSRISALVAGMIAAGVGIDYLHVDRGYLGEAETPFALDCLASELEAFPCRRG